MIRLRDPYLKGAVKCESARENRGCEIGKSPQGSFTGHPGFRRPGALLRVWHFHRFLRTITNFSFILGESKLYSSEA